MNRVIRKIAIGLGIVLLVLIVGAVAIAAIFQDQIGNKLIAALNKQLKSELTVGSFDLSLISGFPNVSATLQEVVLEDVFEEVLLEAREVSFKLGLFSLFGSTVKVKSVFVEDGALNMHIDRKGRANYDILKPSEDKTGGEVGIQLNEARLKDIELIYNDEKSRQTIRSDLNNLAIEGAFANDEFYLESAAELESHFVEIDRTRYLPGTDIAYEAKIYANLKTGVYDFEQVDMVVEDNVFKVDGFVETRPDLTDIDLIFSSDDASLESVIRLLPERFLENFGDFRSKGNFQFEAAINGRLSDKEKPALDIKVGLKNGRISSPRLEHTLKDVTFSAHYSNGENHNARTSVFEIPNFNGVFNNELIELTLDVKNFDDPRIDFTLNGAVPPASVYGLFDSPFVTDGSGLVRINDLHLKGRYKDMLSNNRVERVDMSGQIEFDDAGLVVHEESLAIDRGTINFLNNVLGVKGLEIEGAGNEITLEGTFYNLLPVIFADEQNTKHAELRFFAELNASKMDLGRIVKLTGTGVEQGDVQKAVYDSLREANTEKRAFVTNFFKGTFNAKVDEFRYDQIEGRDFAGKLEFDNNKMLIEGQAEGMEGSFDLDGTLFFESEPFLDARLVCKSVDIKEFFRQSNDFGMEVLQSDHLSGTMNAKLLIHALWDEEGYFQTDKLNVLGAIGIEDGELKKFGLLEQFSDFVKLPDLRHVKFVNLENWLEVKNQTVHIPTMFVRSNALNLTINGEHGFDDRINYNLRVNAGQVIMTKLRRHDPNLDPIPAKKKGLFNLYYNLHGTVADFDSKKDRKQVKNDFRKSERHKKEIQAALLNAFGDIKVIEHIIPEFEDETDPDDDEYIDWEDGW